MQQNKEQWDLTITPKDRLLAVDWKEIWRYRDMFVLFVERNFRTAYKQTILGPLWFIITPVLSVIVYVTVFGGIANIPTDGVPPILFYLLGISVWGYFSSCLSATSNSFVSNADIFGKVYFPRIIMPLVAVTTNLLSFAIQLAIFAVFYIYYVATGTELEIHWQIVLFPLLILLLALMAVGFGMIFSSMTTKYRDLQIMLAKIISLWVYITPVIYPLSMVTNEKLHLAMSLNPVTPVMEAIILVESEGIDLTELRRLYPEQFDGRDIFDIICNVAFKLPMMFRKDRAARVKEKNILERYSGDARRVLEILIDKYAKEGILAFENQDALKVSEIAKIGTPIFIKTTLFGGSTNYKSVINEIEHIFYQPVSNFNYAS